MVDKREQVRKIQRNNIHPPPLPVVPGESKYFTRTLGQINAMRRRQAVKTVQELIRDHNITLDEIEGRA